MAVPDSVSLRNLSGTYTMNKTLSGDADPVLKMQGMGWLVRQGVKYSAITLVIKEYTDENGIVHIDIDQTSTGGFKNDEPRQFDWEWHEKDDPIFGKVKGRGKWTNVSELQEPFLKDGWDPKWLQEADGEVLFSEVDSVGAKGEQWHADQVWGFEIIDGGKRYVQSAVFLLT